MGLTGTPAWLRVSPEEVGWVHPNPRIRDSRCRAFRPREPGLAAWPRGRFEYVRNANRNVRDFFYVFSVVAIFVVLATTLNGCLDVVMAMHRS